MSGLAPLLVGRWWRLGELDDVGRRGLGGVRGILAGRGELSTQGIDLNLQPPAIGTGERVESYGAEFVLPAAAIQINRCGPIGPALR